MSDKMAELAHGLGCTIDHDTFHYVDTIADNLEHIRHVYALAIPSDLLMFNIMRACVGIKDKKDLWFYEERLHRF